LLKLEKGICNMPYTTEEGGRLNNFAVEPKVYRAEPPTKKQQIQYLVLGLGGVFLIGGLIFVAISVS
jgi:hypothetical protein